jgi:hypothetical protein
VKKKYLVVIRWETTPAVVVEAESAAEAEALGHYDGRKVPARVQHALEWDDFVHELEKETEPGILWKISNAARREVALIWAAHWRGPFAEANARGYAVDLAKKYALQSEEQERQEALKALEEMGAQGAT